MVLANQNAKLTGPDQGFLVSRLVLTLKPWERSLYIYIYYRYLYIIDMDIPIRPYKIEIQITTGDESDAPAIFHEL